MADTLQGRIARALSQIKDPRTGNDVYSSQKVRDIAATTAGKVRVSLMFEQGDDPTLARTIRQTLERIEGVTDASVNVVDANPPTRRPADPSTRQPVNPQPALPEILQVELQPVHDAAESCRGHLEPLGR